MKKKKIWIPIVSLVLVAALGTGLALYFSPARRWASMILTSLP